MIVGPKEIEIVFFLKSVLLLSPTLHEQKTERWAAACQNLEERSKGTGTKKCVGWKYQFSEPGRLMGSPGRRIDLGNLEHLDLWSAMFKRDLTYHFTSIRMAFIKKVENDTCW